MIIRSLASLISLLFIASCVQNPGTSIQGPTSGNPGGTIVQGTKTGSTPGPAADANASPADANAAAPAGTTGGSGSSDASGNGGASKPDAASPLAFKHPCADGEHLALCQPVTTLMVKKLPTDAAPIPAAIPEAPPQALH